jgi:hypothetical protein
VALGQLFNELGGLGSQWRVTGCESAPEADSARSERDVRYPMSVRQCQRLFRLVDIRYRLRRPLVAEADPQRQAEHKKTPSAGARPNHRL